MASQESDFVRYYNAMVKTTVMLQSREAPRLFRGTVSVMAYSRENLLSNQTACHAGPDNLSNVLDPSVSWILMSFENVDGQTTTHR